MIGRYILVAIVIISFVLGGGVLFLPQSGEERQPAVTSEDNPLPGNAVGDLPVPTAVQAAREHLAERMAVNTEDILIIETKETQWPDACLGIQEDGVICAQVVTPGWSVFMRANGVEYRYRATSDGKLVKPEN